MPLVNPLDLTYGDIGGLCDGVIPGTNDGLGEGLCSGNTDENNSGML